MIMPPRHAVAVAAVVGLALAAAAASPPYTPDWASLDSRPTPGWFSDSKFGIKMHWGMYAVPSFNNFEKRQDAAQYWRFNQAAVGCPKAQQPNCKGAPYGKMGENNSVRAFHRRAFPGVETYDQVRRRARVVHALCVRGRRQRVLLGCAVAIGLSRCAG